MSSQPQAPDPRPCEVRSGPLHCPCWRLIARDLVSREGKVGRAGSHRRTRHSGQKEESPRKPHPSSPGALEASGITRVEWPQPIPKRLGEGAQAGLETVRHRENVIERRPTKRPGSRGPCRAEWPTAQEGQRGRRGNARERPAPCVPGAVNT